MASLCEWDEKGMSVKIVEVLAQNALWSTGDHFILIRPNVDRTGDDDVVLSASPSYVDSDEIQLVFNGLRMDDILHPRAYSETKYQQKSKQLVLIEAVKAKIFSIVFPGRVPVHPTGHLRTFRRRMGMKL